MPHSNLRAGVERSADDEGGHTDAKQREHGSGALDLGGRAQTGHDAAGRRQVVGSYEDAAQPGIAVQAPVKPCVHPRQEQRKHPAHLLPAAALAFNDGPHRAQEALNALWV